MTATFNTLTGTGGPVAFSARAEAEFDTLSGGGGAVAFTTTAGATSRSFDTLSSVAQAQGFTTSVPSATFTPAKMLVEALQETGPGARLRKAIATAPGASL